MNDATYSGLDITVRLYEQQLFTRDSYDNLLRMNDSQDVLNALRNTAYTVSDQDLQDGDIETVLMKRLEEQYQAIYDQSPDERLIDIMGLRYTYHNLKIITKAYLTGKDLDDLLIPIGHYTLKELKEAVETDYEETLPEAMMATIRRVKTYVDDYKDFNGVSLIYDTAYLNSISDLGKKIGNPEVQQVVQLIVDKENLLMEERMSKQGRSNGFMINNLSHSGGIDKQTLMEGLDVADKKSLMLALNTLPYGNDLSFLLEEGEMSLTELEKRLEEKVANRFRQSRLMAFGPLPVLSYLYFLEQEVANLRLIYVGKSNEMDVNQIEERMRPIYG